MRRSARASSFVLAAAILSVCGAPQLKADDTPSTADLADQVKILQSEVAELRAKEDQNWLTQERTDQIRKIVEETLADARTRSQSAGGADYGYNNGFYIQTPDNKFKFMFNGYMQLRYTFTNAELRNAEAFGSKPPASGDASGIDFRYMRLTFSGNAFTPNLTYLFTGDFATNSTDLNNFQLVDAYVAYKVNDLINIRGGAFLVPYSRLEYISSGLALVDFPALLNPFDPARAMGISVYGDIIKDKLLYELNMNNGPQSNHEGRVAELGGMEDNRPSFASRLQYFGGTGTPADFTDESDLRKDNSTLAWLLEGAFGYDSANTSSNAFPGAQGSEGIVGLSTITSPGFVSKYPLNGDLYRATVDGEAKYQGWEFLAAGFFQQINENPGAGVTLPAGYTDKSSFFEASYYGQIGYMITPQLEVVGRAGQLLTEGGPNRMEEYSMGANYFLFGKNVKLQTDLTYIPNEAALSNTTFGTFINTQDLIARVQLQLKF